MEIAVVRVLLKLSIIPLNLWLMMENGWTVSHMVKGTLLMRKIIGILDNLTKDKRQGGQLFSIEMAYTFKARWRRDLNMDLEWRNLWTLMFMKGSFLMVNSMDKVYTNGKMEAFIKVSLLLEKGKEKEYGNHIMVMFLKATIIMTWNMDGENLLGKMDKSMRANFQTIFVMV